MINGLSSEYDSHVLRCIENVEARDDLTLREREIYKLGHLMLEHVSEYSRDIFSTHSILDTWLDSYRQDHILPTRYIDNKLTEFALFYAMHVLAFYLDDRNEKVPIPNAVVGSKLRPKKDADFMLEVNNAIERSKTNSAYKPLIILDRAEDAPKKRRPIDFGPAHVALLEHNHTETNSIRAEAVILDRIADFNIETQFLGLMGDSAHDYESYTGGKLTEDYTVICTDTLILHGGEIKSGIERINTQTIFHYLGNNNAGEVICTDYYHEGGDNNATTVVCSNSYNANKNSSVNCRYLYYGNFLNIEDEANVSANVKIHDVPSKVEVVETDEEIYVHIAYALIEKLFPHEIAGWSEMKELFNVWFKEFKESGLFPDNFEEHYTETGLLSGKHIKKHDWRREESIYKQFRHIANIVAFLYLCDLARKPNYSSNAIAEANSYRQILHIKRAVIKNEGLLLLIHFEGKYPELALNAKSELGIPWPYSGIPRTLNLPEVTVLKGDPDKYSVEMGHIKSIRAANIIIGSRPDTKIDKAFYIGSQPEFNGLHLRGLHSYKYLPISLECECLGIMKGGRTSPADRLICNDSIIQYGDIKDIVFISAKGGDGVKTHLQKDGVNEAREERCRKYKLDGGELNVGILECRDFEMNGGSCNSEQINTENLTINSGHLKGPMKIRYSGKLNIDPSVTIDENVEIIQVHY